MSKRIRTNGEQINCNRPVPWTEHTGRRFEYTREVLRVAHRTNRLRAVPPKRAERFTSLDCGGRLALLSGQHPYVVTLQMERAVSVQTGVRIPVSITSRLKDEELTFRRS